MSTALMYGRGQTVVASATVTTSSNSGTLSGTALLPVGAAVSLLLNVTANAGDDAGTNGLQVYLQTSPDGGTTWFSPQKFLRVTTSTTAQVINFRSTGIGAVEAAANQVISTTTASSPAIVTNTVLTNVQRIAWTLGSGTGASVTPTATFAVFAIVQPMGATPGC